MYSALYIYHHTCPINLADTRYRHFTVQTQFYAMVVAQLTTLAHANERHPHIMITASKHENSGIGDICLTEKDIAVFDRDAPTTLQFPLSRRIFG